MNTTPKKPIRPLTTSKTAQPKLAASAPARKPPVAPPVYSPQQTPKVLQPKSSSTIQLVCKHGYKNKKKCPHCQQSQQDRNVNKFLGYQTGNKKTIEQDVEKVRKLKTNLAHGSRNDQYGQSGKTRKLLNEINEK